MENWETQKTGFLDKTPSFCDVPAFSTVSVSLGKLYVNHLNMAEFPRQALTKIGVTHPFFGPKPSCSGPICQGAPPQEWCPADQAPWRSGCIPCDLQRLFWGHLRPAAWLKST